ncbi:unnamed protein product, partial [Iphiclides podalirius]
MKTTSVILITGFLVLLNCVTSRGMHPVRVDCFANFVVTNGKGVSEDGFIMNAALSWGKWQLAGRDVTTVNNIGFGSAKAASFRASGRDSSPSGAEGTFKINEGARKIAVVEFSIPFWGRNEIVIRNLDDQFLCKQRGFTSKGSPTINITCHKVTSCKRD